MVGERRRIDFKGRELFQDVIFLRDYAERVVTSFANKIKSEYYGGNISVSIEGIALQHFSASLQKKSIQLHHHVNVMKYFTIFYLMTAKNMLLLLLHTARV